MRIRVADHIASLLVSHSISDLFSVTGGGAMHLNDAFGRCEALRVTYNHHEQACAIAAESYARLSGKLAGVCVTSGPGGTNAITGVLGGWLDSIPMLVISGQVRYDTTVHSTGKPMRQLGDQEYEIVKSIAPMTKYAVMVTDPLMIEYHVERAIYLATHGRPGPVWIDVPLNIQAVTIETDDLVPYDPSEDSSCLPAPISEDTVRQIIDRLKSAKRPLILAGTAIRLANCHDAFIELVDRLNIPVVTAWNAHDVIWNEHPLYMGRPGTVGDRPGNMIIQNCDVLLVLGSRLNIRQISYNWQMFAKDAYKISVDIDPLELSKPTLSLDLPVLGDISDLIHKLNLALEGQSFPVKNEWISGCRRIKELYPVVSSCYYEKKSPVNPYCFLESLFAELKEDDIVVASNGSACVCSFQAAYIKKGQRLYTNSGCASMGYGLPAAIGAAFAAKGKQVTCIEGDGSIQMNLQELQTVVYHRLPMKIVVLNNDGYHSIRQTQSGFFGEPLHGVNTQSGVGFAPFSKLAPAFGLPYFRVDSIDRISGILEEAYRTEGPVFIEVIIDIEQPFSPKLASKRLEDGTMYSPPLDDMAPFLERSEYEAATKLLRG
jgi:acetolactate synthase-1/2/3 large subunit